MFNITVDDKEYKFPKRLTVDQWQRVMKYDISHQQNWVKILATLFNIHPRDLREASDFTIELGIGILASLLNKRKECSYKDFTQLSFGEWVDLDVWTNQGVTTKIDLMLTILGKTKWSDEALHKVEAWIAYRNYIYRQYSELFGLEYEEDEIVEDEEREPVKPESVAEGWFSIIIGLASDNLLNIDAVTEQPLLQTLNFMAHQKQKQIRENFNKLKQQREYELQRNRR